MNYTVSCPILEGFENCKECRVGECKYDICPSDLKLPITITVAEHYYLIDISYTLSRLKAIKDNLFCGNVYRRDYNTLLSVEKELLKLSDEVRKDTKVRSHLRIIMIEDINSGKSMCKDIYKSLRNVAYQTKRGGNFNYYKRNLRNLSNKAIKQTNKLSNNEKKQLLKLKHTHN